MIIVKRDFELNLSSKNEETLSCCSKNITDFKQMNIIWNPSALNIMIFVSTSHHYVSLGHSNVISDSASQISPISIPGSCWSWPANCCQLGKGWICPHISPSEDCWRAWSVSEASEVTTWGLLIACLDWLPGSWPEVAVAAVASQIHCPSLDWLDIFTPFVPLLFSLSFVLM